MNAGQCPATRGPQTCASIGPHARHVWTDPEPATVVERVEALILEAQPIGNTDGLAERIIATVHADRDVVSRSGLVAWVLGHPQTEDEPCSLDDGHGGPCRWDPAPTGVPPCPGHADAGPAPDGGRYGSPCTLPLGHHGGCR